MLPENAQLLILFLVSPILHNLVLVLSFQMMHNEELSRVAAYRASFLFLRKLVALSEGAFAPSYAAED